MWLQVGIRKPDAIVKDLASLERKGIEVIRGDMEEIDPERKVVGVNGKELESDYLVVSLEILEVPNPRHPYGVRGVGETPIIPPPAAVANAVHAAIGVRLTDLPMSPGRIIGALDKGA